MRNLQRLGASKCRECTKLLLEYEHALARINAIVTGRFNDTSVKISALHHWQDSRDAAFRALHSHRAQHKRKEAA